MWEGGCARVWEAGGAVGKSADSNIANTLPTPAPRGDSGVR